MICDLHSAACWLVNVVERSVRRGLMTRRRTLAMQEAERLELGAEPRFKNGQEVDAAAALKSAPLYTLTTIADPSLAVSSRHPTERSLICPPRLNQIPPSHLPRQASLCTANHPPPFSSPSRLISPLHRPTPPPLPPLPAPGQAKSSSIPSKSIIAIYRSWPFALGVSVDSGRRLSSGRKGRGERSRRRRRGKGRGSERLMVRVRVRVR